MACGLSAESTGTQRRVLAYLFECAGHEVITTGDTTLALVAQQVSKHHLIAFVREQLVRLQPSIRST
jgi:hypothetical protein